MLLTRAWACGLRTTARKTQPGRVKSSTYRPSPLTSRGSSRRWILAPIMVVTAMASAPSCGGRVLAGFDLGAVHRLGRGLHGFDDVHVAGAPAEISLETPANLIFGGIGVL